jgi:P27 family predicted phage terminase small subunit
VGRRGPAPLPTRIKALHGETRPSRLNPDEPEPPAWAPVMPDDLSAAAAAVWKRTLAAQAQGVILAAHADILRMYAEAVVRYQDLQARLARSSPLLKGARGTEVVKNPLVAMVRDEANLVRNLARELGLTPSSLSGVRALGVAGDDPFEAFLRRAESGGSRMGGLLRPRVPRQ